MRDIKDIRKQYEIAYANKLCRLNDITLCEKEFCTCKHAAEAWAYIDTVIPENFRKMSIMKFDGMSYDKIDTLIPQSIATQAKDIICNYCFGTSYQDIEKSCVVKKKRKDAILKMLAEKSSKMLDRFKNGNHVVIFGSSTDGPIGRTMVASIILKEAIKLRMTSSKMSGHTYGWVDFAILKQAIRDESKDSYDYRFSDWLVVDNITDPSFTTLAQRAYFSNLLDPFFIDRFNNKLPTILVFKFDIRLPTIHIEELFGPGLASIVNSSATFKIPLSELVIPQEQI